LEHFDKGKGSLVGKTCLSVGTEFPREICTISTVICGLCSGQIVQHCSP